MDTRAEILVKNHAQLEEISVYNCLILLISCIVTGIMTYYDPEVNNFSTICVMGITIAAGFMQTILAFAIISVRREMRAYEN